MFNDDSRYANLPNKKFITPDGREIVYKTRRFLPKGETKLELTRVSVNDGDRLDQISHRTYGNPELFWRLADGNDVLNPNELISEPGKVIKVPMPDFV